MVLMQQGPSHDHPYLQGHVRSIRLILGFNLHFTIWMICWYELILAFAVHACMPPRHRLLSLQIRKLSDTGGGMFRCCHEGI